MRLRLPRNHHQAQVDRLRAFALRRLPQSAAERVDEERFRFLKGFNDFFFAVGVALVGTATQPLCRIDRYREPSFRALDLASCRGPGSAHASCLLPGILLACFFPVLVLRATEMD